MFLLVQPKTSKSSTVPKKRISWMRRYLTFCFAYLNLLPVGRAGLSSVLRVESRNSGHGRLKRTNLALVLTAKILWAEITKTCIKFRK